LEQWGLRVHRPLSLGLLFSLLSFAANAACPGSPSTCGDPMQTATSGSAMYATAYGVTADGATSDDEALKAAVDACAAKGTKLILPPGRILLDGTGSATINLKNCHVEGAGILAGKQGDGASFGTLFLLTSTTVKPFKIGSNWKVSGVGFHWPHQTTGLTPYPFLMSPETPTTATTSWTLDNVVIVNAYNGIQAAGGAFFITNSLMYATNELFEIASIGDSFKVNNVHFTPGPWFNMTGFAAAAAMNAVTNQNMIFRFMGGGGVPAINVNVGNSSGFAWRYGAVVESGVTVGLSTFDWYLDATGTVVEVRAGGTWGPGSSMSGGAICHHYDDANRTQYGNKPCFNIMPGANPSYLDIRDWNGASGGSFVENQASANVTLKNVAVTIGQSADGGDYYGVHTTSNPGGLVVMVQNSNLNGAPGDVHRHGIKTDVAASRLIVQDTLFAYLNDSLNAQAAPTTIVTGNWSFGTTGAQDIVTATLGYATGIVYRSNQWEKPPKAVATACGTGCSVAGGALSGFITVGSTNPTTSGTLTLPFSPYGVGDGLCRFYINGSGTPVAAATAGSGVWNFNSGATDMHGAALFFNCPGQE
jgi:hypothetical protein